MVKVLMMAAEKAQIDVVEMLLGSGADPHAADHTGNTALLYAARSSEPLVRYCSLLSCKDDVQVVRSIAKRVYEADDEAVSNPSWTHGASCKCYMCVCSWNGLT